MPVPSYEEWREYCFTRAYCDFCGSAQETEEEGDARLERFERTFRLHPGVALTYVTRLFESAGLLLGERSPSEIDDGLHYIVNVSCSACLVGITEASIPWPERERCLLAMKPLYRDLMAPVYRDHLGHLASRADAEHRFACYMWWDVIGIYGGMDHPDVDRINDAALDVMSFALTLRSEACNESGLHGLGHWALYLPDRCRAIVLDAMTKRPDWSPALREYALQASEGAVQ